MSQDTNEKMNGGPAAGPTLTELADKLSDLREHLDEIVARLNTLHDRDRVPPAGAQAPAPRRRFVAAGTESGPFHCHECGELSPPDPTGWTLRLCGDDELHPFCPSCDRRHVNRNGVVAPS